MAEAAAPAAQDDGGEEAPHPHPLDLMNLVDDVLVRIVLPFQSDNLLVHVALAALVHPAGTRAGGSSRGPARHTSRII